MPIWDLGGTGEGVLGFGGVGKLSSTSEQNNEFRPVDPNNYLRDQSIRAGDFADVGQSGFSLLGAMGLGEMNQMRRLARGQDSYSAEQLRQSLQQNIAGQQSMAAGARPGNAAMAARTGAIQAGMLGAGLAGQQSLAGIQERQAAQNALNQMLLQQRDQDMQVALGSRNNALKGYGALEDARTSRFTGIANQPTDLEKVAGLVGGAVRTTGGMS